MDLKVYSMTSGGDPGGFVSLQRRPEDAVRNFTDERPGATPGRCMASELRLAGEGRWTCVVSLKLSGGGTEDFDYTITEHLIERGTCFLL